MLHFTILLGFLCVLLAISPEVPACGPVCAMYCQYGKVLDEYGCPTCACYGPPKNSGSPCKGGRKPLDDYFCGRGATHRDCPPKYKCVIAPNDAYAVCCPSPARHWYTPT